MAKKDRSRKDLHFLLQSDKEKLDDPVIQADLDAKGIPPGDPGGIG